MDDFYNVTFKLFTDFSINFLLNEFQNATSFFANKYLLLHLWHFHQDVESKRTFGSHSLHSTLNINNMDWNKDKEKNTETTSLSCLSMYSSKNAENSWPDLFHKI